MKKCITACTLTICILLVVLKIGINFENPNHISSNGKVRYPQTINANKYIYTRGETTQRPTGVPKGYIYLDTTLKKLIYWNGEKWVDGNFINIRDFGAKGDGITDDTAIIQKALNIARDHGGIKLYFPKGIYNITTLRLFKNTNIYLDSNAVIRRIGKSTKMFVNGEIGNFNYSSGYSGDGNIHFSGGTIDLNTLKAPIPSELSTSAFEIAHAENITFKNLKVINGQNGHYFQISSSKNVIFDNCWFGNVQYTNNATKNYELIQIEEATIHSFPTFGTYDGTISKDIVIQNCYFENIIRAIGTHGYPRDKDGITPLRYCENIRITNNVFKNAISNFGHFEGFKKVFFENNILENSGESPIYFSQSKNYSIKNNKFINTKGS
ncbi:glycosyl hydrolase family 28-related protein [Bacillus salipaludis]|uniref:glycosyl hydrolase family 28-related protein n=1 Tax=Bacillus salipaludis TaxID=2547811 RepID=UPI001404B978|nr:right-handed parallel beta-helix repeat-containing protein [Bacillus salipaludis]